MNKGLVIASICLLGFAQVSANDAVVESAGNRGDVAKGWGFSLGQVGIDSQTAAEEGVGSSATSLTLSYQGHSESLSFATGLNLLFLSDKDRISNVVIDNDGDISTASSSALGYGLFGELGYSHVFASGNTAFDMMGGIEFISAERSIANCSNCDSESIGIDSGLYIKPQFSFYNQGRFVFRVAYQHYLSGDLEGGLNLGFSWQY
jgi:hypothetical protein